MMPDHGSPTVPSFQDDTAAGDARSRIVAAAAALVAQGGREAATTRAVAAAASVQAPTLYRLFGDKDGLLDAVAEHALARHVATKAQRAPAEDPVEDLRRAWDEHVAFGLAHPAVYGLMNGVRPGLPSAAAVAGLDILRERIRRIARTGRLRVSEELAVDLVQAMGVGTVLTLLQRPDGDRDGLSGAGWDAALSAILGAEPPQDRVGVSGAASALRASLGELAGLTPGEKHLMDELLQRIAASR